MGIECEPLLTAAWLIGVGGCGGSSGADVGVPDIGGSTSSSATPGSAGGACSPSTSCCSISTSSDCAGGRSKWSMRGGVACPGAIGVAGLVPGLDGTDLSSAGEGNCRVARIIGSVVSNISRIAGGDRRCERDLSDLLEVVCGSLQISGGVYVGVGFDFLDVESRACERAGTCRLLGGGGSSAPASSSAFRRS